MVNFWQHKKVLITGAHGFLGKHLLEAFFNLNCTVIAPTSNEYDLRNSIYINALLAMNPDIDFIFNLAANVGGIGYNQVHPYSLFFDNIQIGINLIDAAIKYRVKKFIQLGTVCAYPKFTPVPFQESTLWDGYPEETNAPYGIAKRVLLTQLQAARQEFGFNGIYILPTNLYGPYDHFEPERSHVIPALIKKFVEAKEQDWNEIVVWGTGKASRDFLHVKDAVRGILLLAEKYDCPEPVNLGSGQEVRISSLVYMLQELLNYQGKITWDTSKPDGQPRRSLRIWKAQELGWKPEVGLKEGLRDTINWYLENK